MVRILRIITIPVFVLSSANLVMLRNILIQSTSEEFEFTPNFNITSRNKKRKTAMWRSQVKYLMIGAQKSGSTTLCSYLLQHPLIIGAKEKETSCFKDRWDESDPYCKNWWRRKRLAKNRSAYVTGDCTPGYIWKTEPVVERASKAFPWAKIIAILRNPRDRAYSQHRMDLDRGRLTRKTWPTDFTEHAHLNLEEIRKSGLVPHWKFILPDKETQSLKDWRLAKIDMATFNNFHGSQKEVEAWQNYHEQFPVEGVVSRGMYAIQLNRWLSGFRRNNFFVLKTEELSDDLAKDTMNHVYKHIGLPEFELENITAKNMGSSHEPMSIEIQELLDRFYKPYNDQLVKILGEKWKDPW